MEMGEWFEVEVQADVVVADEIVGGVKTAVLATLAHEAVSSPAALTVLLTDDEAIRELNRSFRDEDKPTDVLSFPAGEPMPGMLELDEPPYLGDIVISVPYAARQAEKGGHSLLAELQLLTIHGVLHLLGYDHLEPTEKMEMWAAQTAVLHKLGIANVTPTEE
ncbi:MAG: rRNA maturation RNase YbeY [Chloroflexi bacterium]|nr:MAG: rRNA maturation RNase YbeY [Chloroflexota bacterium]